jgi:outer membrane protease
MYLHDGTDAYAGKIALSGKGITYKQNIFLWWLNASFSLGLTKKLTADFIFSYSPFWYGEGYDRHHHRSLDFLDKVEGHTAYKLASHFMLQIREPVVLGLSINYLSIPMKVGSSASKKTWETQYRAFDSSLGGMSLSEFSTAVFLRYRFSF